MKSRGFLIKYAVLLLPLALTNCSMPSGSGEPYGSNHQQSIRQHDRLPKRITTLVVVYSDNDVGVNKAIKMAMNVQLEHHLQRNGFTVVTTDREVPQMIEYSRGSGTREEGAIEIGKFLNANAILMVSILDIVAHKEEAPQYIIPPYYGGSPRLPAETYSVMTSVKIVETETAQVLWAKVINKKQKRGETAADAIINAANLVGDHLPIAGN